MVAVKQEERKDETRERGRRLRLRELTGWSVMIYHILGT